MKKIAFNENYFKSENERSFYWAGLLAADGCLMDRIQIFKSGDKILGKSRSKKINLTLEAL